MSTDLSPKQATAMLEQAESLVESGEFDPDTFDLISNDEVTDEPPSTPPQAEQKELDYVQMLAQERAEKLALQQELAKLQTPQEPPKEETTEKEPNLAELFGDFDEEGLQKGIDYLVNQKVEKLLADKLSHIEQKYTQDVQNEHLNAIHAVHKDAETVVASDEFAKWVQSQPSYIQPSIVAVVEQGNAKQIIEVLNDYKKTLAPPKTNDQDDIQQKADEVIKNTTQAVPTSLTEMGGQVVTDPMQAVANMSSDKMLDAMSGWTPEQIENFLNRQI